VGQGHTLNNRCGAIEGGGVVGVYGG